MIYLLFATKKINKKIEMKMKKIKKRKENLWYVCRNTVAF